MEIRKYQDSDREKVVSLWNEVFPDDPPHNEPNGLIDSKLLVDDLIFIVEDQNQIIGACMAGYDGHRGWLYSVAVSSNKRRSGVGRKLVEFAVNSLKSLGCVKVNLQIRSTNTEVAEFYKSLGFGVEDRVSMGVLLKNA